MSLMNEVLLRDANISSYKATMGGRFQTFQDLLIKHSVERPPKSVQIFSPSDVEKIVEYAVERYDDSLFLITLAHTVVHSYFKKFRLYQYIFDTLYVTSLKQVNPNQVEFPATVVSMKGCVEVPKQAEEVTA